MSWMNEYDVTQAYERWSPRDHPNLAAAAEALYGLMNWTNGNSDGWPYWIKPQRAATRLMKALQDAHDTSRRDGPDSIEDITVKELTSLLSPVKAFLTRQGADWKAVLSG